MRRIALLLLALPAGCASAPRSHFAAALQDGAPEAPAVAGDAEPLPPEARDDAPLPVPGQAYPQQDWGIAAVVRTAEIPFEGVNDSVSSFVPMLFYEGDRWFVRGTAGGAHLWDWGGLELNALTRLRFFDIPAEYQNEVQGDTADFGLQLHDELDYGWWEAELMSDGRGNLHANGRAGTSFVTKNWVIIPAINVQYGFSDFVSRYYALEPLTGQSADGAFVVSPEITARYHVISDLYLLGTLRYNLFGSEIRDLDAVDRPGSYEALIGFGFFQDRGGAQFAGQPREPELGEDRETELVPHVRVAHGWGTQSNLNSILQGDIEDDEFNNQMTSVFYGYPLTDRLFGLPLQIFLAPGFAYHWSSEVQDPTFELVAKIHIYYTIHWPIRWRLGAAEGVSWIEQVTYLEEQDMIDKGYRPSQLMNYLDFTLDFNVGDIFGADDLKGLWIGASIHHRSSIFESASQFGRIKGGSNYPSFYLQYDLF